MKIAWGKNSKMKRQPVVVSTKPGLPFGVDSDTDEAEKEETAGANTNCPGTKPLDTAESLQRQGDKLAEEGKYHEALRRWEAALTLAPGNAILHEQKAQATELDPLWPEAWVTLGRAQLNFGEPDSAILSFDKALAIKPDHDGARADRETAVRLVKKRGHLHSSGLSTNKRRFTVGENSVKGAEGEEKADETAVQSG
ncbi:tetratricopeptide repeat protein 33 [Panicum miliaceum]|uniref:Tetratricopeptide repeat protein 33 n=1 Tax=Panicum miliaceum TaxID=4540 RepID=A0A3L6RUT9_PANMI|nr:tetratricopeptide repeat protein 33 [Panicum miliaceum]